MNAAWWPRNEFKDDDPGAEVVLQADSGVSIGHRGVEGKSQTDGPGVRAERLLLSAHAEEVIEAC